MGSDFNMRSESYDSISRTGFYGDTIRKVVEFACPDKNDIILDIGTGTGALALPLAKYAKKVIGIDPSDKMLEKAVEKININGVNNVDFKHGTFLDYDDLKFDVIVSTFAFHHLTDDEKRMAIDKMKKNLKSGGRVVIGDVVWTFDPEKYHLKYLIIKLIIKLYEKVKRARGSESDFSLESPHHHIPKIDDVVGMFEKRGFVCKIKKINPITAVICARLQ